MRRSNRLRLAVACLAILTLAITLTACGRQATAPAAGAPAGTEQTPASAGAPAATPAPQEPVVLRILTPIHSPEAAEKDLKPLLESFKQQYPNVEFEVEAITNYSKLNEKLSTALAANMLYDVFLIGAGWIEAFHNHLLPLDNLLSEADKADYVGSVLEAGYYKGTLYGIPAVLDTRIILYRKDILAEEGIEPPTTWDELVTAAVKLTRRNANGELERAGIDFVWKDLRQHWYRFLWQNGGSLFDPDITRPTFNSPEAVAALQFMADLVQKHKVVDFGFESGVPNTSTLTLGKAAMFAGHNDYQKELNKHPELKGKVGVLPALKNQKGIQADFHGGSYWVGSRTTKHPEIVLALIRHLTTPEATLNHTVSRGQVPPRKSLADSDWVKNNEIIQGAMANLQYDRREGGPEQWLEIRGGFNAALEAAIRGEKTAQQALDELAAKAADAMKR